MKKSRCFFILLAAVVVSFALITVFFVKIGFVAGMFFLAASWTTLVSVLRFSSSRTIPASTRINRNLHPIEAAPVRQIKVIKEEAVLITA
ncbi:MAG TPA: hypothetical protein VKR32_15480 [Puia sp.]|nr:hypothetical protein [Puia sp.]